jgi:hypothetical protein
MSRKNEVAHTPATTVLEPLRATLDAWPARRAAELALVQERFDTRLLAIVEARANAMLDVLAS